MRTNAEVFINQIEFISDELHPASNVGNFRNLAENIERLNILPIKNLNLKFSDDIWDFAPILPEEKQALVNTRFLFSDIPDRFKNDAKFYIYWTVIHDKKRRISIQTLASQLVLLRVFFIYLKEEYIPSINSIEYVIISKFLEHIRDKGISDGTVAGYLVAIIYFLRFYNNNMTDKDFSPLISKLKEDNNKLQILIRLDDEKKTKDIPSEYFNSFVSKCIKIIDSESFDINTRGFAAMMIILSQTGLRRKQLCALKTKAVTKVSILNNTKTAYFLEFYEMKRKVENLSNKKTKTILNELGYKAYVLLEELFKDRRNELETDFLYCPTGLKVLPASPSTFGRHLRKFSVRFGDDIGAVNVSAKFPDLKTVKFSDFKKAYATSNRKLETNYKDDDIISYPTSHQFRVHLCTELYYKNIPLEVIQHYMNHLSEEMTDYYVRREPYTEREENFATAVIRTIVEEDTKPLGAGSDKLIKKIDEFIEKGNFNIKKDIDTIISELKRRMPIKEKLGGICIKSGPKRDCSKDGQSDELYCAYGKCPNHFHLYTMADISYSKCKTLYKTMEHNKTQGFTKQSQKEKNKLIHVVENSLQPELEQLKEKINEKGSDWIKEKYPVLTPIIDNLDTITKEVDLWLKLK